MALQQISVFLENKKGRLAEVAGLLAREGINIRALSLADTTDFGVLRLMVNDPDKCLQILRGGSFVAQQTEVIAVEVQDKPGGLAMVLDVFDQHGINIEYMYAFVEKRTAAAIVVFRIDDPARATGILGKAGVSVLSAEDIRKL